MKKTLLLLVLLTVGMASTFAVNPDYFTFEIGSGMSYEFDGGTTATASTFGFNYKFDNTFGAGFSFKNIAGASVDTINISINPMENVTLVMYLGNVNATDAAVGAGIGYDFFTKKSTLFTSLGFYLDWFGSDAATGTIASIEDGGVFTMGLKTRIGL